MFSTQQKTFLLLTLSLLSLISIAQSDRDSIVQVHRTLMTDYLRLKSNMEERTWTKLVELGQKADELIFTDKLLIERYLDRELRKNQELKKELEKIKLEMGVYKKESDVQQMILDEQRFLNKAMLIGLIASGVLFLVFLILFIDRQTRFSTLKVELEYLWSKKEEPSTSAIDNEKLDEMEDRLQKLKNDNQLLKTQMSEYQLEEKNLRTNLAEEQASRLRVEQEIKALLIRLHQNAE